MRYHLLLALAVGILLSGCQARQGHREQVQKLEMALKLSEAKASTLQKELEATLHELDKCRDQRAKFEAEALQEKSRNRIMQREINRLHEQSG